MTRTRRGLRTLADGPRGTRRGPEARRSRAGGPSEGERRKPGACAMQNPPAADARPGLRRAGDSLPARKLGTPACGASLRLRRAGWR